MKEYLLVKYYDSSAHPRCLHLICKALAYGPDSMITLSCDDDGDDYDKIIELNPSITNVYNDTVQFYGQRMSISGPINGIYCIMFQGRYPFPITFWNPAYGQFHVLPPIPQPPMLAGLLGRGVRDVEQYPGDWCYEDIFGGFDFDPLSKDYKVFCMSKYGALYSYNSLVCFHEYSLASNSWEEIHHSQIAYPPDHEDHIFKRMISAREKLAFTFNGSCHWIGFRMDEEGSFCVQMVSFEMARHAFCLTYIPRAVISEVESMSFEGKLMTVDDCVAVAFLRKDDSISETDCSIIDNSTIGIAVMKEYGVEESWVIAYNIVLNLPSKLVGIIDSI